MELIEALSTILAKDADGVDEGVDADQLRTPAMPVGITAAEVDPDGIAPRPAPLRRCHVTDTEDHVMTRSDQPLDQRAADQPRRAGDEHTHRQCLREAGRVACRALVSGTGASLLSTAAIAALARQETGSAVSGANATSHWLWGDSAKWRRRASWRHTATGYAIHHASALFWAAFFEGATRRTRSPATLAAAAAVTAAGAYVVDYHAVPRRLTPGFESRIPKGGLFIVYAAFSAGLWGARVLHQKVERRLEQRRLESGSPGARSPSRPSAVPAAPAASTARPVARGTLPTP